jgi:hypothetical protein
MCNYGLANERSLVGATFPNANVSTTGLNNLEQQQVCKCHIVRNACKASSSTLQFAADEHITLFL